MKVLIALDSFKGSLSSMEAGEAAAIGIIKAHPEVEIIIKPLADGGEGTTETLIEGLDGNTIEVNVKDPLGREIKATYGIVNDTAIIEMAQASGLELLSSGELDPYLANTYGTGQMILDALDRGIKQFIIGIGGSATTEGGIGMLNVLGVRFLDQDNQELPPVFASLTRVQKLDLTNISSKLKDCEFQIACDVTNPLYGDNGAIAVFGKQKGVKDEAIPIMDSAMKNYAEAVAKITGVDNSQIEGAGAAGGLGFAFLSFFPKVSLKPGFEIISEALEFESILKEVDVVLTGEGRLDSQTALGKGPVGLAKLAKRLNVKKVIAIAGSVTEEASQLNKEGIDAFFSILREPLALEEAMKKKITEKNIELTTEQIFRLLKK